MARMDVSETGADFSAHHRRTWRHYRAGARGGWRGTRRHLKRDSNAICLPLCCQPALLPPRDKRAVAQSAPIETSIIIITAPAAAAAAAASAAAITGRVVFKNGALENHVRASVRDARRGARPE